MNRVMEIAGQISEVNQRMVGKIKELIDYRNEATHKEAYLNERVQFKEFIVKYLKG